jgi:hypothetical protein
MTQMLIHLGLVRCPACDSQLTVEREQDRRVARMYHRTSSDCSFSEKSFRVDRLTGYSEEVNHAQEPAEVPLPSRRLPPSRTQRQGEDRNPPEAS